MSIKVGNPYAQNRSSRVRAPISFALASALILGALGFLGGGTAAAPKPPGSAAVAAHGQSIVIAAKKKPRALLRYRATLDTRGRLVVELRSNANKVKVSYTSGKRKRSKTAKFRKGAVIVIVPAAATKVSARTKATRRLRASTRTVVRPTPVPPAPVLPPPTPTQQPATPTPAPVRVLRVPLPPIGPASPDTPPPTRWYEAMQTLNCGLIADTAAPPDTMPPGQRAMFASLAQLCLTLTAQGGSMDWGAAAGAVEQTAGEPNCLVLAARSMLSAAVVAHQSDPSAVLARGEAATGTACPVSVTDVSVDSSDPGGSYTLRITGPYLFQVTGVTVNTSGLSVVDGSTDTSVDPPLVTVLASSSACLPQGTAVSVVVSGAGYQAAHLFIPELSLGDCP